MFGLCQPYSLRYVRMACDPPQETKAKDDIDKFQFKLVELVIIWNFMYWAPPSQLRQHAWRQALVFRVTQLRRNQNCRRIELSQLHMTNRNQHVVSNCELIKSKAIAECDKIWFDYTQ